MDLSLLPNIYEFISNTYPFSQLDDLEKDAVATKIKISYYSTDDVLDNEQITGIGLYMIRSGAIEERNKHDGSLRCRYGVGDSFGYTQIDKEGESDYKVVFLENTLLYLLPKTILQFLISKNKAVGEYFNSRESVRLSSTHNYADEKGSVGALNKTISMICNRDLAIVSKDTKIFETAVRLGEQNTDLAMVMDGQSLLGIVTKSDITLKAVARGLDVNEPISKIMTTKVITIDENKSVFDALEIMVMRNVKNLPVVSNNKIVGNVSTTSLLQNTQLQAVYVAQEASRTNSLSSLIKLSEHKQEIFQTLVETHVTPHTIQKMMTHLADTFVRAAIRLAEAELGQPPVDYAFVVAGSQARCEVQFLSDQDNCIVTKNKLSEEHFNYFKNLALKVNEALHKFGYPLCEGNFMASNPRWCVSLDEWKGYYTEWISNTTEDAILSSSVFLDMRGVYGDEFLVKQLRQHLVDTAYNNSRFLAILGQISLAVAPPLGTFRQFVLTKDGDNKPYLNIKKQAINLIIEIARIYGIKAQSMATDTYERLKAAVEAQIIKIEDYEELSEAYTFLNYVRFNHQLSSLKKGEKLSNHLNPNDLSQFERNHLRDAFRIISKHQKNLSVSIGGLRGGIL